MGVLWISLKHMIPGIFTWFALIMLPTMGFSLAFTVLMPSQILYQTDARWPFFLPFWGILGDFDIDAVSAFTPEDSWFADHATHGLLWFYMFIATVVFVNLLIAQMSSSYAQVEEAASQFHNWSYMELVREAKDQLSPWQPPLNIWEIFSYTWMYVRGGCRRPRHEVEKGFRWDTDPKHGAQIIEMQRKFALRTVKKRAEVEDDTLDHKVMRIGEAQGTLEAKLDQVTESIGSFLMSMKYEKEQARAAAKVPDPMAKNEGEKPTPSLPPGLGHNGSAAPEAHREAPPPPPSAATAAGATTDSSQPPPPEHRPAPPPPSAAQAQAAPAAAAPATAPAAQ